MLDLQRIVSFFWESPENFKNPIVLSLKESLGLLNFRKLKKY